MTLAPVLRLPKTRRRNLVLRHGVWIFRKKIHGKTYRRSTGCRDYKMAEKRAAQIESAILEGAFGWVHTPAPTVSDWVTTYLAVKQPTLKRPDCVSRALDAFAAFAGMGAKRIDALTRADCERFLNDLKARGWAQNTVRTAHCVLATAWNYAITGERMTMTNPWSFPMVKRVIRTRVLTVAEQQAVWIHLTPLDQRFFLMDLMSGLRHGEMEGLKDSDLDFVRKQIRVFGKGAKLRYLPMAPACEAVLRAQLAWRDSGAPGLVRHRWPVHRVGAGYVWPFKAHSMRRHVAAALQAAHVARFTVHDLRRTFATRCAELGVPMKKLQAWLGHASITTTAEHYVHLSVDHDLETMAGVCAQATKGTL